MGRRNETDEGTIDMKYMLLVPNQESNLVLLL